MKNAHIKWKVERTFNRWKFYCFPLFIRNERAKSLIHSICTNKEKEHHIHTCKAKFLSHIQNKCEQISFELFYVCEYEIIFIGIKCLNFPKEILSVADTDVFKNNNIIKCI